MYAIGHAFLLFFIDVFKRAVSFINSKQPRCDLISDKKGGKQFRLPFVVHNVHEPRGLHEFF